MTESEAREEICRVGRSLFERGYVHATAGNISVRLDDVGGRGLPDHARPMPAWVFWSPPGWRGWMRRRSSSAATRPARPSRCTPRFTGRPAPLMPDTAVSSTPTARTAWR